MRYENAAQAIADFQILPTLLALLSFITSALQ